MTENLSEEDWQQALIAYLKRLMRERDIDFRILSQKLGQVGVELERVSLANKINRGTFSAAFLMQLLDALAEREDWLKEIAKDLRPR